MSWKLGKLSFQTQINQCKITVVTSKKERGVELKKNIQFYLDWVNHNYVVMYYCRNWNVLFYFLFNTTSNIGLTSP